MPTNPESFRNRHGKGGTRSDGIPRLEMPSEGFCGRQSRWSKTPSRQNPPRLSNNTAGSRPAPIRPIPWAMPLHPAI
ncbi:hypothetical protein [Neisseria polysaccharea]|uniref:hypothetical protein n=1 Tax=Neisseria polysaccharea TaxID=489 RepID=UPI0011124794